MNSSFSIEILAPFGALLRPRDRDLLSLPASDQELQQLLLEHRLLVFRGYAPFPDKPSLAGYASTWGPLLEWSFGTVFEVVEHDAPNNYLFTSGSVPFHWDGAFAHQVPWLQAFQCVEAPTNSRAHSQGGETLFCDTSLVWLALNEKQREVWRNIEFEYATEKVAHYGGRIRAPLVDSHRLTGETVLRFNEPANATTVDLNTPQVILHGLPEGEAKDFTSELIDRIYDKEVLYAHQWQAGDCLIADNLVLLHGRSAYQTKVPRRLWRAHVLLSEELSS